MNRPAFAPRPPAGAPARPREDVQALVTLPRPPSSYQPKARELRVTIKVVNEGAPFVAIQLFEVGREAGTWWPVRRWDEGRGIITDAIAIRRGELRAVHEALGRALAEIDADDAGTGEGSGRS